MRPLASALSAGRKGVDTVARESTADDPSLKPSQTDYLTWLTKNHAAAEAKFEKNRYEQIAAKALVDVAESPFWAEMTARLADFGDQYQSETSYQLFAV